MKRKTQTKLANVAMALVLLAGLGCIAWILLEQPQSESAEMDSSERSSARRPKEHVEPNIGDLLSLVNTKLQQPLVPVEVKPDAVASERNKPRVAWPSVTLDCIISSDTTKVAVFSSGSELFTCGRGDKFLNLSVEEIGDNDVSLTFSGEKRKFQVRGTETEK